MDQETGKKIGISATISPILYEKLKTESSKERRSMAQLIEMLLEDYFKDKKTKGVK